MSRRQRSMGPTCPLPPRIVRRRPWPLPSTLRGRPKREGARASLWFVALFLCLLRSGATGGTGGGDDDDGIFMWMRTSLGVEVRHPLTVRTGAAASDGRRGVYAVSRLPPASRIVSFPLSAAISLEQADKEVEEEEEEEEECSLDRKTRELAAWILSERALGRDSKYAAWLRRLPPPGTFNLFSGGSVVSEAALDIATRQRLPYALDLADRRAAVVVAHRLFLAKHKKKKHKNQSNRKKHLGKMDDDTDEVSLSLYQWAMSMVLSRAFDVPIKSKGHVTRAIFPGLDFMNHCSRSAEAAALPGGGAAGGAALKSLRVDIMNNVLVLSTTKAGGTVPAGSELCLSYGHAMTSPVWQLQQYGFVEDDDPLFAAEPALSSLSLSSSSSPSSLSSPSSVSSLRKDEVVLRLERTAEFGTDLAWKLLSTRGIVGLRVSDQGLVLDDSLAAVRLLALTEREVTPEASLQIFEARKAVGASEEQRALEILSSLCRNAMRRRHAARKELKQLRMKRRKERRKRKKQKKRKKKQKKRGKRKWWEAASAREEHMDALLDRATQRESMVLHEYMTKVLVPTVEKSREILWTHKENEEKAKEYRRYQKTKDGL